MDGNNTFLLAFMEEVILQTRKIAEEGATASAEEQKKCLERIWFNMDLIHHLPEIIREESDWDADRFREMLNEYDRIWPPFWGRRMGDIFEACLKKAEN